MTGNIFKASLQGIASGSEVAYGAMADAKKKANERRLFYDTLLAGHVIDLEII